MADQEFDKREAGSRLDGILSDISRLDAVLSGVVRDYRSYRLGEQSDMDEAMRTIDSRLRDLQNSIDRVRGRLH